MIILLPPFTDEEAETQRSLATCPKQPNELWGLGPGHNLQSAGQGGLSYPSPDLCHQTGDFKGQFIFGVHHCAFWGLGEETVVGSPHFSPAPP